MKLTIVRLRRFTAQDRLDLSKIWPLADITALENGLDEHRRLYAARFNDRLLAAVKVIIEDDRGELADFMVREVTRRRGVGSYLLEEALAQNPAVKQWWLANTGGGDREALAPFLQKHGFVAGPGGWRWQRA